ncbi:ABC transporter permease subunit [Cupriavidus basilensis]
MVSRSARYENNESAASTMGIHQRHLKFAVYIVVSAAYGMLGAFIFLTKLRISPASAFDINWTGYIIFIVVIGGIGTLEGPIIGCIVYFVMRQYLADTGSTYLILLGLIGIVVMRFYPRGIWGELAARRGIAFLPTRWHLPAGYPSAPPAPEGERRAAEVAGNR